MIIGKEVEAMECLAGEVAEVVHVLGEFARHFLYWTLMSVAALLCSIVMPIWCCFLRGFDVLGARWYNNMVYAEDDMVLRHGCCCCW